MSIQNKKVGDVMLGVGSFPVVTENTILKEALEKMDDYRLGIACIIGRNNQLSGIITDGDIRRKILSVQKPLAAFFIDDVINQSIKSPITTSSGTSLIDAVDLMGDRQVWDLPIIDDGKLVGLLHLHSVIKVLLAE